ncbi:MAG: phosphate acyltransferase, partial [candidate division Zixibacteria bacterium]|nr:phosphate acyltransferase [candidate division Zixibacteria bacterium]
QKVTSKKPRAALVVPSETDSWPAFFDAFTRGFIDPFVIGDEKLFKKTADESHIDISSFHLIDINQPNMALKAAAKMAIAGEIDMIVPGRITPEETVSILSAGDLGFVTPGRIMSHVGVLKAVSYPKLLLVTDGLVHEQPDLKTKIDLLSNLARVAKAIGVTDPRTAVVAAVEVIYPQMPATTDAAVLAKMYDRGQIKGVRVDGPLSFDIAVDAFAAESKGITRSVVAGQADAILASSKLVAQGVCQAMSLYAKCSSGGVLVGGRVPVAVNFVSEPTASRLCSILLAVLLA